MKKHFVDSAKKTIIARGVSTLFHPVVLALFVPFFVVYRESRDFWYSTKWMVFSSLFLVLALVVLLALRKKEFFSDFDFQKREQRGVFYMIAAGSAVLYFLTAIFFKGIVFPLSIVALGIILSCIVMEICNRYLKVSVHAAVASAFIVTVGFLYGMLGFLATFWILPWVMWSRLFLGKHTREELVAGVVVGTFTTCLTFLIGKLLS